MIPFHLPGDQELHGSFPFTFKIHRLTANVHPHTHNFIEYTYVTHGSAIETINGVERPIKPGTFTLLWPHQVHQLSIPPGQELHLYVGAIGLQALFSSDASAAQLNELLLCASAKADPSFSLDDELAAELLPLFAKMHTEAHSKQAWNQLMFQAKLIEVLIILDRSSNHANNAAAPNAPARRNGKMREIIYYVYQNYRDNIKLATLAARFHLSVPHISSSFRLFSGEHFHSFLEKIRISHACSLLVSSDESVTSICYEVGFTSYPTFCRVFQARLNMSPTAYRKLHQDL